MHAKGSPLMAGRETVRKLRRQENTVLLLLLLLLVIELRFSDLPTVA
jgi:hypothetical protein